MAKLKKSEMYHFVAMDEKGRTVSSCDGKVYDEEHMLGSPLVREVAEKADAVSSEGKMCPTCDRMFHAYRTGFDHGFKVGTMKAIEGLNEAFEKTARMFGRSEQQNANGSKMSH